jgi:hypothetical protein
MPIMPGDNPAIMAVGTPNVDEHDGTCKIPSKRDIPITTGTTLTPCRSEGSRARRGYSGRPVIDPVSVWGRVGRCALTKIPACRLKISASEGRSSGGEEWGGGVTSSSSLSSSSSSSSLLWIWARREFPPPVPLLPPGQCSSPVSFASVPVVICCRHGRPPISPHPQVR